MKQISQNIIELLQTMNYDEIIFVSSDIISKSNFWVMLLVINYIHEFLELNNDIKEKIKISSNCSNTYIYFKTKPHTKMLVFYFDDMSYSGKQIESSIPKIEDNHKDNFKLYLALGFISKTAINVIKENKPNFNLLKDTEKIISNRETLENWFDKTDTKKICKNYFSIIDTEDDIIYSLFIMIFYTIFCNNKEDYSDLVDNFIHIDNAEVIELFMSLLSISDNGIQCYDNIIPIYFDHKLADGLSTFQKFLRFGTYPNNNSKCEYESLINNCEYIKTDSKYDNLCKKKLTDIEDKFSCPYSYYKKLQYTYHKNKINSKKYH